MKKENQNAKIPFDNHHAAKTLKSGVFAPPYDKELPQQDKKSKDGK